MAETWDESKPAGSRAPALGDDDVREFKRAVRERMAEDHQFQSTENPAFGAAGGYKIGKHNFVTLVQRNTSKTTTSDEVSLVCKSASGNPELILTPPSAGTDRQLTKNAGQNINIVAGDLSTGLITEDYIGAGAVTNAKLGSSAVTTDKIATGGVNQINLSANSVTAIKIADANVTYEKLGAWSLRADKWIQEAAGDNVYFSYGFLSGQWTGYHSNTTWTDIVELYFHTGGTYRFYTGTDMDNSIPTGYCRVLKNGVQAIYWSQSQSDPAYNSTDLAISPRDHILMQTYISSGSYQIRALLQLRGLYRCGLFAYQRIFLT